MVNLLGFLSSSMSFFFFFSHSYSFLFFWISMRQREKFHGWVCWPTRFPWDFLLVIFVINLWLNDEFLKKKKKCSLKPWWLVLSLYLLFWLILKSDITLKDFFFFVLFLSLYMFNLFICKHSLTVSKMVWYSILLEHAIFVENHDDFTNFFD